MQQTDEKTEATLSVVREKIILLTNAKVTGKYELTVELNFSEGGIGDAFIHTNSRERIKCDRRI